MSITTFKKYNRKYIIITSMTDDQLPTESTILDEGVCVIHTPSGELKDATGCRVGDGIHTFGSLPWLGEEETVAIVNLATPVISINGTSVKAEISQPYGWIKGASSGFTYNVENLDWGEDLYGFDLNDQGYWESRNQGQDESFAICKVNLDVSTTSNIDIDVINNAECNYDYAMFTDLDDEITPDMVDPTAGFAGDPYFSFQHDSEVDDCTEYHNRTITYTGVTSGQHFFYVLFYKDGGDAEGKDSVQFKILEPAAYSYAEATIPTVNRATTTITTSADSSNKTLTLTASNNQSTGYVTGSNQTKTATINLTSSGNTVTATENIGNKKVSITLNPSVDIVEPAIPQVASVSTSGVITMQSTQDPGLIEGGPCFTYVVTPQVSGAAYGFSENSNGYWESQNGLGTSEGQHSSAAVCRIDFDIVENCDISFKVINSGESNFDFAIFSNLDTTLNLTSTADSSNVFKSFKGQSSTSEVDLTYTNVSTGNHYIYIKFRKDGSSDSGNDSVQFKIVDIPRSSTAPTITQSTYTLPAASVSASGGGLTSGAGSCSATGTKVTLGSKTTTVPTSGAYVKVNGSGSVSRAAINATSSAGYTGSVNTTASAATSKSSNTATAYYPITSYYPNMVNVKFVNKTSYAYQVLGYLSTNSSASYSIANGVMPSTGMLTVSTSATASNPLSYYCPVGSTLILFCHYGSTNVTSSVSTTSGTVGSSTRCRYVVVPASATTITLL